MPSYLLCTSDESIRAQIPQREINLPLNLHKGDWLKFKNNAGQIVNGLISEVKYSLSELTSPPLMFISHINAAPEPAQEIAELIRGDAGTVQLILQDVATNNVVETLYVRPEDFRMRRDDIFYNGLGFDYRVKQITYASYFNARGQHHAVAIVERQSAEAVSSADINRALTARRRTVAGQVDRALLGVAPSPDLGYGSSSDRGSPAQLATPPIGRREDFYAYLASPRPVAPTARYASARDVASLYETPATVLATDFRTPEELYSFHVRNNSDFG